MYVAQVTDAADITQPGVRFKGNPRGTRAPMFRQAFAKRRALVPAGVFYEWRETRVAKQPFAVARSDGEPLAFAAVPARARKTGPTYVYQCPVCGKKFRHSKRNPHLGSHKAPGGWQCSGRTGYFVETKY